MDPEITELLGRLPELTDEELTGLEERLLALFDDTASEDPTADELAAMTELQQAIAQVRELLMTRTAEAEERRAEAARIAAEVRGETEPGDGDGEDDEDADPGSGDGAAPETGEPPNEPVDEPAPQAVAASGDDPPVRLPAVARVAARSKKNMRNAPPPVKPALDAPTDRRAVITAAANLPGIVAGTELASITDIAEALIKRQHQLRGPGNGYEQIPVATFNTEYPEDRVLSNDNWQHNQELIDAVTKPKALVASGGLCAPLTPSYDLANISVADRPVRDSLAQFRADRGGIRYITPLRFTSFSTAVTAWTVANDASPSNPTTKPCYHVACGTETTAVIEAITQCVEFGNLGARAFPEQVADALEKVMAWHSRYAERRILTAIGNGSTKVTSGQLLGAARDILTTLDRSVAAYRSRHRTAENLPLRLILPFWTHDLMRADLTRELPGSSQERLATADAYIDTFFAARKVNVTWAMDGEQTGVVQEFGTQAAGALLGWPLHVYGYLFHEGAWLFLDGGTLDLGIVRDSTLNSTNDYRVFSESFEGETMVGLESLRLDITVCPSGATSGTVTVSDCVTGS